MKNYRWLLWGVVGVIVIALIAWAVVKKQQTDNSPLKVGFVGPLTTSAALWGDGAKNMVQLAVDDINANGGINGRPLAVDYEDGKCTSQDAVSATQKLTQSGVKFIIGGHCSPETVGMAPLSKNGQFVMIAGVTSADNAVASSSYAFRTSPANQLFVDTISDQALTRNYKKIATITEQTAFAQGYTTDLAKAYPAKGGTIVDSEQFKTEDTDYRTQLQKIKAANPDAIFISPQSPASAVNIIKQMGDLGMTTPIFGNQVFVSKDVFDKTNQSKLLTSAFTLIPYVDNTSGTASTLASTYKTKFGSDVPYNFAYMAGVYDATHVLANGLKQCGENTKCVADYLHKVTYNGVSATYSFQSNGDSSFGSFAILTIDASGKLITTPIK